MRTASIALVLALGFCARVLAQDEGTAGATVDGSAEAMATEDEETWEQPSILIVARPDTPEQVVLGVRELLAVAGELVDPDGYVREARARGLPPESAEAMQAILPEMHPELDLVVVVGTNRPSRATLFSLRYHDRFGLEILEEEHSIRGGVMTEQARARTLAETRLALAVITRPRGGLQQIGGGVAPGEREPGLAVHVGIEAGFGIGTREMELPTRSGIFTLGTSVFAATALQLAIDVEPTARGPLAIGADLEYQTSIGWVVTDTRAMRDTGVRSQRLAAGVSLSYRLGSSVDDVSVGGGLSYAARAFASEAPLSIPDYTMHGPALTLGVVVPISRQFVVISVFPELQWIVDVGGALAQLGASPSALAVGGTARIRLRILNELFAEIAYRESHAFVDTIVGAGATDVERFATLRLMYRP